MAIASIQRHVLIISYRNFACHHQLHRPPLFSLPLTKEEEKLCKEKTSCNPTNQKKHSKLKKERKREIIKKKTQGTCKRVHLHEPPNQISISCNCALEGDQPTIPTLLLLRAKQVSEKFEPNRKIELNYAVQFGNFGLVKKLNALQFLATFFTKEEPTENQNVSRLKSTMGQII